MQHSKNERVGKHIPLISGKFHETFINPAQIRFSVAKKNLAELWKGLVQAGFGKKQRMALLAVGGGTGH